jgi:hypothetical protein
MRVFKDEFDAFLECAILARGFLRRVECGHDRLLALGRQRPGRPVEHDAAPLESVKAITPPRRVTRAHSSSSAGLSGAGPGDLKIIAAILERATAQKSLAHLGLEPSRRRAARRARWGTSTAPELRVP